MRGRYCLGGAMAPFDGLLLKPVLAACFCGRCRTCMGRTAADHRRRGFKRRTFGVRAARSGAGAVRLSWRTAAPRNSTDGHRPFHSSPRDVRLALARRSRTKLPKTVKPGAPLASGLQPLAQEARFLGDPSSLDRSEHAPFLAVTACFSLHSPASCFCCARSSSNQAPIARSGVRTSHTAAKARAMPSVCCSNRRLWRTP